VNTDTFIRLLASAFVLWSCRSLADDLAKASQNPIGDVVSLPLEVWHYDGIADGRSANMLIAKPVYPVNLGDVNLINRLVVPYIGLDSGSSDGDFGLIDIPGIPTGDNGFGNIQYQAFFTPAQPGDVIWGVGPVFEFPSNTENLGSDKWSAGIGAVALSMPGNWVIGGMLMNFWSFAGPSDADDVNKLVFQYFINYNLDDGWYLTSTPLITANWEADSDKRWTVPFGGGVGRLVKFGNQPVDFKLQAFSNVERPEHGPDWSVMFAVKFLFPK